jgi:hypothetical protein
MTLLLAMSAARPVARIAKEALAETARTPLCAEENEHTSIR